MSPPVKPEQDPGHVPTGAEWAAAQYGPHRFGQDPNAQLPMGRVPTGAEWDQMRRSSNPSKLTFPALPTPKFVADQTKRLNPNAGKPDQSILEQIDARVSPYTEAAGAGVRKVAEGFDTAAQMLGPMGGAASVVGPALRQVAAPIVEHPFSTGALIAASKASPVVTGGLITADMLMNLGKYGYQTVHEAMMTPEERAIAQRDPNRISGEAALFQALFVGLGGLGIASHVNQELGFTKTLGEADPALHSFVQSTAGAQALGTGAAEHGLPATASPYPPESPLSAAWRDGYEKPRVQVPGTVEQIPTPEAAPPVAEPTVPPGAPTEPVGATTVAGDAAALGQRFGGERPPDHTALVEAFKEQLGRPLRSSETVNRAGDTYILHDKHEGALWDTAVPVEKLRAGLQEPKATSGLTPIEGTGETRTRGLATSTVSRVAEDIKSLWSDLPEYNRMNISEQAHRATDIVAKDPARAKSIAMGDEPAPPGLHAEAVFVALRNKARAEGDVGLIHDLATGGLTEQATTMGQKLRLLAENDPEDPVAKIRRISDKRSEGRGAAKAIKSETDVAEKSTLGNLKSLMDFFESQRC